MTVEIEHRQISFSAGAGGIAAGTRGAEGPERPRTCPVCGGTTVLALTEAMAEPGFPQAMAERHGAGTDVHMGQTSSGEWWVCRGSIRGR